MTEARTDFVVNAKAKGFQDLQQQAAKLIEAAAKANKDVAQGFSKAEKGGKAFRKEMKGIEADLKSLTKTQLDLTKALMGVGKGTPLFKQLKENLKNVNAEFGRLSSIKDKLQSLYGPKGPGGQPLTAQHMAQGGFMQGLLQGGLNVNLQRGPGMWRQGAGLATGTMLRGFAAAPFGGVQGLQQGLAGIPGVGGAMAGQLGNVMGFGEQALNLYQTRQSAMALFGSGGAGLQRIQALRSKAEAGVNPEDFYAPGRKGFATPQEIRARASYAASRMKTPTEQKELTAEKTSYWGMAMGGRGPIGSAVREHVKAQLPMYTKESVEKRYAEMITKGEAPEKAYQEARRKAGQQAATREANRPWQLVHTEGEKYGMGEAQAIQAVMPMLHAGGGGISQVEQQGMVPAMFAAQQLYGIGAETSGAFLGAGRRGGMIGAKGQGAEALASTIGDALKLGLEGSEVTDYVQKMAQGIESWRQTGMPINRNSITALSGAFSQLGLGGLRGSIMGQQLGKSIQQISQTGPQDTMDLMMLEKFGGFKGGGVEEYVNAQERMENLGGKGGIGAPELMSLIQQLIVAGGGDVKGVGVATLKDQLAKKGMQMSWGEAKFMARASMSPEGLSEEDQKELKRIQAEMLGGAKGAPQGAAGLAEQAKLMLKTPEGEALRRAAEIQNKQTGVGQAILKPLQDLQDSSVNISKAFQTLADGPLTVVSDMVDHFSEVLAKLSKRLDEGGDFWNAIGKAFGGAL